MSPEIARNEGRARLAAAAQARTQARLAKQLGCSQGFLSKVLSGQKEANDALKTRAATVLGIELDAWTRTAAAAAVERAPAPPDGEPGEISIEDRPGLALDVTLEQLRDVRTKMDEARDPVEWARLARIESAALRTIAELRGEIGSGREMKLRQELDALRAEMGRFGTAVREALRPYPEAARALGAALRQLEPSTETSA